jgi:hypothetical protein
VSTGVPFFPAIFVSGMSAQARANFEQRHLIVGRKMIRSAVPRPPQQPRAARHYCRWGAVGAFDGNRHGQAASLSRSISRAIRLRYVNGCK